MKRLLIGLVAAASLVASVLVLVTSVSSPTAAQTLPTVTFTNTSPAVEAGSSNPAAELHRRQRQISVTITTVNNCNAGTRSPLSNGQYTLAAAENNPTKAAGSEITGLLANTCNWEVTFRNTVGFCGVVATVRGYASGSGGTPNIAGGVVDLGSPDSDGTLVLSGAGSGALRYGGGHVTEINFAATSTCSTSFSVGTPDINVPQINAQGQTDDGTNNAYRGLEFTVSFSSSTTGCIQTPGVYVIDAAGEAALKSGTNAPFLVDQTLTQLSGSARCEYTVSFSPTEIGNLRLASTPAATAQVSGANAQTTARGNVVPAGFLSATYRPITVGVVVRSTFPTDEVFTTNDTVDYFINVNSPCGGFLGVIPSTFGSQGDSASTLVFPGTVTVYGSALNSIQNTAKVYSVNAFADPAGNRPCSVTVTQRNGPERCSVVGGPSQTNTYSAGATVLTFDFNHICEPAGVVSGDPDDDGDGPPAPPTIDLGDNVDTGPPAPPTIDLPEGEGETTAPSGPREEGRTG